MKTNLLHSKFIHKSSLALFGVLLFLLLGIFSCDKYFFCEHGSGEVITKELDISNFSGIDLGVGANVTISQCSVYVVNVRGHENVLSNMWTFLIGDTWEIRYDDCFKNYILDIDIKMPNLEHVDLSGSGQIVINDFIDQNGLRISVLGSGSIEINEFLMEEPNKLRVNISGSGNVDFLEQVNASELYVNISGSGNLTGHKDFSELSFLEVSLFGSGSYKGFAIKTDTASAKLAGSGNIEVFVNNFLDVMLSGSGNVYYKGNPEIIYNITGSGLIIDAN